MLKKVKKCKRIYKNFMVGKENMSVAFWNVPF